MSKLTIYTVRHGQTYLNLFGRFQGWSDIDLTEDGKQDALKAGERLANIKFDGVYSSDLSRAYKTAEGILSKNTETKIETPIKMPDFREAFFGSFEALPTKDAMKDIDSTIGEGAYNALIKKYGSDGVFDLFKEKDPLHLAENAKEIWTRIDNGFKQIAANHPEGGNILLVIHGTLIRSMGERWGEPEMAFASIGNGAISRLELQDDLSIEIKEFNDTTTIW